MNGATSPGTVEVIVQRAPAEWWEILAALGPLMVLLGTILFAFITRKRWMGSTAAARSMFRQGWEAEAAALAQQAEADDRAEWWRRTEWALELSLDKKPHAQAVGLRTLDALACSELARREDLELLDAARRTVSARRRIENQARQEPGSTGGHPT